MSIAAWTWRTTPPATIAREILTQVRERRAVLYVFLAAGRILLRDECDVSQVDSWLCTVAPRSTEAGILALLMEGTAMEARSEAGRAA